MKGVGSVSTKQLTKNAARYQTDISKVSLLNALANGGPLVWVSALIMGFGNLMAGQVIKALLFLAIEVAFVAFMVIPNGGLHWLKLLPSLGDRVTEEVWNEELFIYEYIKGDNSQQILLYAVATMVVIAAFFIIWRSSVRSGFVALNIKKSGKKVPTIIDDAKELLDSNIHKLLMFPPFMMLMIFTVVPLFYMMLMAFTNYSKVGDHLTLFDWVGMENFISLFDSSSALGRQFMPVLTWTLIWAFFATFLNFFAGTVMAMIINRPSTRFKGLWRTVFSLTIAVPQFVSLLILSKMLDTGGGTLGSGGGIITQLIENLFGYHLQFGLDILTTRIGIILVNLWIGVPYSMLLCSGILMNIPEDLYESARIDRTGPVRRFLKITLPYMLFVTGPYLITQFIGNLNNFNVIYLLSGGGPGDLSQYTNGAKGTDLLITWLYKLSLGADRNYKLASVIGIFVFLISAILSLVVYNRSSAVKGEEHFQ